jgi:signal transduction histidine kinase
MTLAQPLRIVLIDDNLADRTLIMRQLEKDFPELLVEQIRQEQELTQILASGEFDLVITDYQLRWSNGLDVLRRIKQQYPNCPVIMFTSTGSEEIAVEAMKTGLDDYVLKSPSRRIRLPVAVRVALERSEAKQRAALLDLRLQGLLDLLKVGVFRVNSDGTFTFIDCNRAFLDLLGVQSLQEVEEQQLLNPRELWADESTIDRDLEIKLNRSDGSSIWLSISTTLTKIEGSSVIDGLVEDISARKIAELEIQQLNQTLEQRVRDRTRELETTNRKLIHANQDLEEFAYSVSHDLREPLRAIQGFGMLLFEDEYDRLDPRSQENLQHILDSSRLADRLIHDLLAYSQLSRIEIPLQLAPLSQIVAEVLNELSFKLQQNNASVTVVEPLLEVMGNRTILIQVIANLITNAIAFVAPNISPQIEIWTERITTPVFEPDRVRFWVNDNGIGIPAESQQDIFNPFVRLHSNEIYPGSGIGLAIVRKGVERMGGRVGVESETGRGSRFWFELPSFEG